MSFHEQIHLPADRKQLAAIRRFIEQHAEKTPATAEEIQDLVQAVDEAATNIIVHGYHDNAGKDGQGEIEIDLEYQPGRLIVILRDQAVLFDPTTVPAPNLHLPLHQRPVGGLGVHLIRSCIDEFTHAPRPDGGNVLKMVKYLKAI